MYPNHFVISIQALRVHGYVRGVDNATVGTYALRRMHAVTAGDHTTCLLTFYLVVQF
jgi:hypothetical protein